MAYEEENNFKRGGLEGYKKSIKNMQHVGGGWGQWEDERLIGEGDDILGIKSAKLYNNN